MGFFSKTEDKSGNNAVFGGLCAMAVGAICIVAGGRKQNKATTSEYVRKGLGPWNELKEKNEDLYYRCLKDLES